MSGPKPGAPGGTREDRGSAEDVASEGLEARLASAAASAGAAVSTHAARVGKVVNGRYRIDGVIGAGGFGVVYRAINLAVGQPVALKLMLGEHVSNVSQVARFEREAVSVSSLRAPNTIRVFDFGRDEDGNLFIVMELLAGQPLSSVLQTQGALSPRRAVHVAVQIAKSLAEAHEAGIVHRDLKPDNIFLADLPGEEDYVKVLDFGIAKLVGDNHAAANELTRAGAVIGTPTYMSPEQSRGAPIDARSDLYSLGVVLFRMLAGKPPFEAPSMMALAWKHNSEPPPDVLELGRPEDPIPAALGSLVAKLLEKEPRDRPISARAVISALSTVQTGVPVVSLPTGAPRRVDPEAATVEIREARTVELPAEAPAGPVDKTVAVPPQVLARAAALDPQLVERATSRLAEHVGPIARVVAKKAAGKAKDARDFVRLLAEQLEPKERERFVTGLGFRS